MKKTVVGVNLLLLCMFTYLSGCSSATNVRPKTANTHSDGTIASMELVKEPSQNRNIKIYDMFYWSQGEKVEAYVTEPVKPGKYPLFVECHGGYVGPMGKTHVQSALTMDDVIHAPDTFIRVYPQYRGYANSEGAVGGLLQDAIDSQNAVIAVDSRSNVEARSVYLLGVSLGGGVVLKLASMMQNVCAVVAISPFVGWNIVGAWATKNANTNLIAEQQSALGFEAYGVYKPGAKLYDENSPEVSKIDTPVLLLQGTGDDKVAWQTVQIFYEDMRKAKKTVKLIMYPGGQHGLNDKYLNQSNQAIKEWFNKYGN